MAAVPVPPLIDLGAVLVGGLTGTLLAVRKRFDLVGCASLAIVAGVGGGIIGDVLLQQGPPAALQDSRYLITALVAAAVGFYRSDDVARIGRVLVTVAGERVVRRPVGVVPAAARGRRDHRDRRHGGVAAARGPLRMACPAPAGRRTRHRTCLSRGADTASATDAVHSEDP
jgi:glycine transporter